MHFEVQIPILSLAFPSLVPPSRETAQWLWINQNRNSFCTDHQRSSVLGLSWKRRLFPHWILAECSISSSAKLETDCVVWCAKCWQKAGGRFSQQWVAGCAPVLGGLRWIRIPCDISVCLQFRSEFFVLALMPFQQKDSVMIAHSYFRALAWKQHNLNVYCGPECSICCGLLLYTSWQTATRKQ